MGRCGSWWPFSFEAPSACTWGGQHTTKQTHPPDTIKTSPILRETFNIDRQSLVPPSAPYTHKHTHTGELIAGCAASAVNKQQESNMWSATKFTHTGLKRCIRKRKKRKWNKAQRHLLFKKKNNPKLHCLISNRFNIKQVVIKSLLLVIRLKYWWQPIFLIHLLFFALL